MSDRNKVWWSVVGAAVVAAVLVIFLREKSLINIVSIIGFVLSILGLLIACIQIMSVKQIAEKTQMEVKASIERYNDRLMLSDLSNKKALIDEIQHYLKADKMELCILRMKELKGIINNLRNDDQFKWLLKKSNFGDVFSSFTIDLNNCQEQDIDGRKKVNKVAVIQNLEELSTLFMSFESKLKTNNHA